jgi:hypothetical protein
MSKVELDINSYEFADDIARAVLADAYKTNSAIIETLKQKPTLEEWQAEDLRSYKKDRKAMKRVLKYFSTAKQLEDLGLKDL